MVQHAYLSAAAEYLAPVMGHPENRPTKGGQQIGKFQFKLPLQIAVQRGKGLIQQNSLRLGAEDSGQRHPLLLSAGELGGVVMLQPLQPEPADSIR